MTQELEATAVGQRDTLMTTELVPEQVLPKVLTTFGLTATYVFIICWITGSSVMAAGGWTAIPMWVLGILTFLVPAGMAVAELGNLWPGEGGVYIWATRTMGENLGFRRRLPVVDTGDPQRRVVAGDHRAVPAAWRSTPSSV